MLSSYRWSINGTAVSPIFKEDLAKDIELESGQQFFREKISGKFAFIDQDFNFINDSLFETEFILLCEQFITDWKPYFVGRFMKTDCSFDLDGKLIEVAVEAVDNYNKILSGLEVEYDLIKLSPAITSLKIDKRPLIQVYNPGSEVVSCFIGGMYWEQPVIDVITDINHLTNDLKFKLSSGMIQATLVKTGTPSPVSGLYIGKANGLDGFSHPMDLFIMGGYSLTSYYYSPSDGPLYTEHWEYAIIRNSDNVELFHSGLYDSLVESGEVLLTENATGVQNLTAMIQGYGIYMRYLLDITGTFQGETIYPIPVEDILANNRNYRNVCPFSYDCITMQDLNGLILQYGFISP